MSYRVSDYIDVRARANELGLTLPQGMVFLPFNFASARSARELAHQSSVVDIRSALKKNGITITEPPTTEGRVWLQEGAPIEWVGPTIFIPLAILSQNPSAIAIALNVISTYLTDFFKASSSIRRSNITIIIEKNERGSTKIIDYHGSSDLSELNDIIRTVMKEK